MQKQADNAAASVSTVCSGTTGADSWCSGNVTLTLSGTEPKPNNSLNGGEIVIADDSQSKRGAQPYTFEVSKEGSNDVSYWVYSTVGDTSEKGQTHVKIDRSDPKAVCDVKSSPTFGEWYTGNVLIEAKSTDAVSGVYENLFSSGGTTAKNSITLSQTGKNIGVSLTAKDYAYNTNQVSCGTFSIDNTAPVLDSFTVPDASPYGSGSLSFSVSGHDGESGVNSVIIARYGSVLNYLTRFVYEVKQSSLDFKRLLSSLETDETGVFKTRTTKQLTGRGYSVGLIADPSFVFLTIADTDAVLFRDNESVIEYYAKVTGVF